MQVRRVHADTRVWLSRTERLANSLANLVLTVHQLRHLPEGMQVGAQPDAALAQLAAGLASRCADHAVCWQAVVRHHIPVAPEPLLRKVMVICASLQPSWHRPWWPHGLLAD